ncbi:MAG: DNA gyrase inhibitor YacG [Planctomycetota bacterium]
MPSYECPTCRKVVKVERKEDARFRPFCSDRCKMIDLGRWLDGTYAVSEPMRLDDLPVEEDSGGG